MEGRGGGGEEGERVKARPRIPPEKNGETLDRRQNTGSVRSPLAIAQQLVHCAIAVSTAVLGPRQGCCYLIVRATLGVLRPVNRYGYIRASLHYIHIVQELCESRGGRPGLSVLTSLLVSVDVKIYCTVLRHWSQLVPNMSHDI